MKFFFFFSDQIDFCIYSDSLIVNMLIIINLAKILVYNVGNVVLDMKLRNRFKASWISADNLTLVKDRRPLFLARISLHA